MPIDRTIDVTGIDLVRTLKPLAFFPSDPTVKLVDGHFQRATITPTGPGLLDLTTDPTDGESVGLLCRREYVRLAMDPAGRIRASNGSDWWRVRCGQRTRGGW